MKKECSVIIIPTYSSVLVLDNYNKLWFNKDISVTSELAHPQHLYIVSNEEIKEGDWCYDFMMKSIHQHKNVYSQKIIASTDPQLQITNNLEYTQLFPNEKDFKFYLPQIPQSFINSYIEEYNAGRKIEKVEVEYDFIYEYCEIGKMHCHGYTTHGCDNCAAKEKHSSETKIKINPDNTINIKPLKEDVNTLANKYCSKVLENDLTIEGVKQEYTIEQRAQIFGLMYFAFVAGSEID